MLCNPAVPAARNRDSSEQSILMRSLVQTLERPRVGFGVALLPRLGTDDARAVSSDVHAGLEVIPHVRRPLEIRRDAEALQV